jgi:two-component system, NarL family, nitrate/nitrite response regulator NarL
MVAPLRTHRPSELVRVHVTGRDPLVRNGLVGLLSQYPTMDVIGAAAPEASPSPLTQVVIHDAGPGGLDLLPANGAPHLVLVPDAEGAARAMRAGARGVLRRGADPSWLVAAVRAVASGLIVSDPELSQPTTPPDPGPLSRREVEVLALVAEGLPNKLIADRLKISEHTAKFHVNAILDKLKAGSRTEAVVAAARRGWLRL